MPRCVRHPTGSGVRWASSASRRSRNRAETLALRAEESRAAPCVRGTRALCPIDGLAAARCGLLPCTTDRYRSHVDLPSPQAAIRVDNPRSASRDSPRASQPSEKRLRRVHFRGPKSPAGNRRSLPRGSGPGTISSRPSPCRCRFPPFWSSHSSRRPSSAMRVRWSSFSTAAAFALRRNDQPCGVHSPGPSPFWACAAG